MMERAYRRFLTERWLFAALAVLHLVPVWLVTYIPTTDGPSHVYNAFVHLHLHDPAYPLFGQTFEIDPRPLPNWLSQAALVPLVAVFSPGVAEKVLVSLYVFLFLAAARFFAGAVDPDRRWLAFLAFPFVFNWSFHFGFYNFCLSLAFYLLALACWWRRRARPDLRLAAEMTALLLLCYFSHIVAVVLALFSLGVLWLALLPAAIRENRWRRHLWHPVILAPQALLPLWFVVSQSGEAVAKTASSPRLLVEDLAGLQMLFTFGDWPPRLALVLVIAVLGFFTVRRRVSARDGIRWQEEDAFLFLAIALVGIYFFSPEKMAGGSLLQPRLTLFPVLVLIVWLAPAPAAPGDGLRRGAIAVLTALAVWNLVNVEQAWRSLDQDAGQVIAAADGIEPGATVLSLMFDQFPDTPGPVMRIHTFNRVDTEKGLVDWSDYEAVSGVFPVRFREGVSVPPLWEIQRDPDRIDIDRYAAATDYVYCFKMPPDSDLAGRLTQQYDLVRQVGEARLYQRRTLQ
ncbi:MAG TPA: hypothetical protein VH988_03835 [Thermoanaerobaculia bacterium]|jgi:hypothetical protein|nr:hypothetical protein [Thermoanaerobaculia bacterium]